MGDDNVASGGSEVRLGLTAQAEAVSVARGFVREHGPGLPPWCRDDLELLVSELVTNAVKHGRPAITLTLNFAPPLVGASVHDEGTTMPPARPREVPFDATGGRGLLIVDRLASSWGVIPTDTPPGKIVWFHLAAPPEG